MFVELSAMRHVDAISQPELEEPHWVATRPASLRIHRRKAVSEVPIPESGQSSLSATDPDPPDDVCKGYGGLPIFKLPFEGAEVCLLLRQSGRLQARRLLQLRRRCNKYDQLVLSSQRLFCNSL